MIMKRLFTIMCLISVMLMSSAQEFVPLMKDGDTLSIQHAATNVVDINDDGVLDIVISGEGAEGIFISGGDKTFTISTDANFIASGIHSCIDNGDIDADGDIDFIFNGWGPVSPNGIALNDGSGVLSLSTTYEIGESAPTSGFADFNNDALLDYFFFGNGQGHCAIYFQAQDGTFAKDSSSFAAYNFTDPQVSVIDFNNDGYMDIFVNGWENFQGGRFSKIFINNYFGGFAVAEQANIIQKGFGSATWFDVDADGNMDLLLNGDGGADNEGSSDIYRLYKNNNGTLEEAATFSDYRQISVGGGARFADIDNDGDADVIVTGWSNPSSDKKSQDGRQVTAIFECTDATNFTYVRHAWSDSEFVPGVSESDMEVGDFNNDHKIDIVVSGFSGNFGRRIAGVIFNDMATANTVPGAPSNLIAADITGGGVKFSWDAGTDTETPVGGLTYSMYLKDKTNSKWLINPKADLTDGKRKVTGLGNVVNSLSWPIYDLPDGDYEWSVQSVDGIYEGSTFPTPLALTILDGVISNVGVERNISDAIDAIIYAADGMVNVKMNAMPNRAGLKVYTLDGRKVYSSPITSSEISVNLKEGLYIIQLTNDGKTRTEKLVLF